MPYVCPFCRFNPSSHSLKKIEKDGSLYFYTCPSEATLYYDVKSILNHYKGVLSEIPEDKEWIWIFDSKGFTFEHAIQTSVAIELAKLISTFKNLKKIIIINPTFYISIPYKIVMPFLNKKIKNNIEIKNMEEVKIENEQLKKENEQLKKEIEKLKEKIRSYVATLSIQKN